MTVDVIAFYVFSIFLVLSSIRVITVSNPVHAVLFLIFAFFNATGLFILLGAEFIAMILAIVYVGAVAVLFLFVVMMLDIDFSLLRSKTKSYFSIGALIGLTLLAEIYLIMSSWGQGNFVQNKVASPTPNPDLVTNTHALGLILYTDYLLLFQIAGLILLVAMIGAIVLTLRTRSGVRKQNVAEQNKRSKEQTIEMVSVEIGKGAV